MAAWRLAISASLAALAADSSASTADSRRRAGALSAVEADAEPEADVGPASASAPLRPASSCHAGLGLG